MKRQQHRRSWFSIIDHRADGKQHVLFDGETTLDMAIGRARMYADATIGPLCIQVFRGRSIGRQLYELTRDA